MYSCSDRTMSHSNDPESLHTCDLRCLGPLTFHTTAVGNQVSLSQGARLAERKRSSFHHGLVFSNRPVRVRETVCLRVTGCAPNWHGGLRVGFTTVPPAGRILPPLAIPDLTVKPGHWAAVVPEACCREGAQLEVWVTHGGNVYIQNKNGRAIKLLEGLDLSRRLWAMIDIYGQTCSVLLQGSKKKDIFGTRRSCSPPQGWTQRAPSLCFDYNQVSSPISVSRSDKHGCSCKNHHMSRPDHRQTLDLNSVENCAVCLSKEPEVTLLCGHRCLCFQCAARVIQEFGTCPLCRQKL
ncbi:E3 ubiquitin-protein ligase NEURL3 isoform X1 [Hypomesus transpacificus]|uniref:E3 ubiquitin-protein ligase NEURL3 isoform X1 n=1 Tax=Hypomesus transpacificus TaxID=137520 RepID=UPI001F07BBEA|nr:E3 ubiquitin-protein ligase NEURL3 isoform X1 [Hypomesus transpacificus]